MPLPFDNATSWLLAGVAVVMIGIAKSGFGSGVGVVAVPLFVFAFGPGRSADAVAALLPLLIVADIFSVHHHWGTWDRRNLRVLAAGTLVGIAIGAVVLWWLIGRPDVGWRLSGDGPAATDPRQAAERNMQMAIGVICVLYVVADQIKARFAPGFRLHAGYLSGSAAGAVAGVTTTIAHAAGPIIMIYLLGQHLAKQRFIGTAVIYFFTVNLFKQATVYPVLGLTRLETLVPGLWLVPLVPLGTWLGLRLNRWMSDRLFRITVLVITFASGIKLIVG